MVWHQSPRADVALGHELDFIPSRGRSLRPSQKQFSIIKERLKIYNIPKDHES
jgi:hypothetical protein